MLMVKCCFDIEYNGIHFFSLYIRLGTFVSPVKWTQSQLEWCQMTQSVQNRMPQQSNFPHPTPFKDIVSCLGFHMILLVYIELFDVPLWKKEKKQVKNVYSELSWCKALLNTCCMHMFKLKQWWAEQSKQSQKHVFCLCCPLSVEQLWWTLGHSSPIRPASRPNLTTGGWNGDLWWSSALWVLP